jgi:hypothetical protein
MDMFVLTELIGLRIRASQLRALVNAVVNLRVPYDAGKLSGACTTGGILSSTQLQRRV